jgi:hypothetical protein
MWVNGLGFTMMVLKAWPLWCNAWKILLSPSSVHQYHLSLPLIVECFMVGTHLRCLSEGRQSTWQSTCFFHHVKLIHTLRGPKKE